jgi:pyrimidine operon attenuation protein/uracil phosphoribosyltransferase
MSDRANPRTPVPAKPVRAVWKFSLPLEVTFELAMPVGAEILTVDTQYAGGRGEQACLWALVDPDAPTEIRHFQMLGTGHREAVGQVAYVGTYMLTGGSFVAHVFEVEA